MPGAAPGLFGRSQAETFDEPKMNPIATGERPVTDPEPAHPNPQLQRSRWTSLDGPWSFLCDDERKLLHPSEITRSDER